jgi:hypothetical protein
MSQNSSYQGFSYLFAWWCKDPDPGPDPDPHKKWRLRIRIPETPKVTDPTDPNPDTKHCFAGMRPSEPRNPDPDSFENAGSGLGTALNEPKTFSLWRLFRLRLKRGADSVFSPDVSFESSSRGPIAFHAHRVVRGVIEGKKYFFLTTTFGMQMWLSIHRSKHNVQCHKFKVYIYLLEVSWLLNQG